MSDRGQLAMVNLFRNNDDEKISNPMAEVTVFIEFEQTNPDRFFALEGYMAVNVCEEYWTHFEIPDTYEEFKKCLRYTHNIRQLGIIMDYQKTPGANGGNGNEASICVSGKAVTTKTIAAEIPKDVDVIFTHPWYVLASATKDSYPLVAKRLKNIYSPQVIVKTSDGREELFPVLTLPRHNVSDFTYFLQSMKELADDTTFKKDMDEIKTDVPCAYDPIHVASKCYHDLRDAAVKSGPSMSEEVFDRCINAMLAANLIATSTQKKAKSMDPCLSGQKSFTVAYAI